jgi:CheY-like chemotaxis protein
MQGPILVVDDEQDVVRFLSRLLDDHGYSVRTATDAVQAVAAIEAERPALILLDLQMPHETGTDLYRKLRQHPVWKNIPVIVVSGLAGRRLAVSPAVPVLDKPIDELQLLDEVRRVVGA